MKIDDKKITFEVNQSTVDLFVLATKTLDIPPDEAFGQWVRSLAKQALEVGDSFEGPPDVKYLSMSSKPVASPKLERRIRNWAYKKDGYAYYMLRAFFVVKDRDGEVHRSEMQKAFNALLGHETSSDSIAPFLSSFRQMSSTSRYAFGPIFIYQYSSGQDLVILHPATKGIVLSLEDEFNPKSK